MLCRYCTYHQLILRRLSEIERTNSYFSFRCPLISALAIGITSLYYYSENYKKDRHARFYCMPRGSAHRGIIMHDHAINKAKSQPAEQKSMQLQR